MGYNQLRSTEDGLLAFYGLAQATENVEAGQWATSGAGDSGGPMFDPQGNLVGITTGGGLRHTSEGFIKISYYVDLNSPQSREFLAEVLAPMSH